MDNYKAVVGVLWFAVMWGEKVFEDVWVFITGNVLLHTGRNMTHCFANIATITCRTSKLMYYPGFKIKGNGIFKTEKIFNYVEHKN